MAKLVARLLVKANSSGSIPDILQISYTDDVSKEMANINYLCTYDLYGPVRKLFDAGG